MTCAALLDLVICKGATFPKVLRWESSTCVMKAITAISQTAPARVTAVAHGLPDGWRVAVTSVRGMTEINAPSNPPKNSHYMKVSLPFANPSDFVDLLCVDAVGFSVYTGGGVLWYNQPVDLAGYTARMHIRDQVDSATTLLELTTVNGRIVLNNTVKTITLTVSATDTAALTFTSGFYDLEMVSPGAVVTRILEGAVSVVNEVTR